MCLVVLARNCIALILCIVLHLFLRDIRTGNGNEKEWELSHGNRMGISLNIGNENGKAWEYTARKWKEVETRNPVPGYLHYNRYEVLL